MAERSFLYILQSNEDCFGFGIHQRILAFDQLETGTRQRPFQPNGAGRRVAGQENPWPGGRLGSLRPHVVQRSKCIS
jgi:hypothetical protein